MAACNKRIIRVFPRRTSYTPDDEFVFIGAPPPLFIPPHDEVHVSCTFTWDMELCGELQWLWQGVTGRPVLLGGPAYGSPAGDFTPGLYVKKGITFTSRGCNSRCPWCMVPERDGGLKELPVTAGNIINDNNFLQCSISHKDKVFEMLKTQKRICFKGGLQCDLVDSHFVDAIKGLSIDELWLACDIDAHLPAFTRAAAMLTAAGFTREHIHCYALIGDDMEKNEQRLQAIYAAGAMPFAMLLQGEERKDYGMDWNKFVGQWCRPARTKKHCEEGSSYKDYRR